MARTVSQYFIENVLLYVLEQYKESSNWQNMLDASLSLIIDAREKSIEVSDLFKIRRKSIEEIESMDEGDLDFVGRMINCERDYGESNRDYYIRIVKYTKSNTAGTADAIIDQVKKISGSEDIVYFDECPATYAIFARQGTRPTIEELRGLSPAGVLGLSVVPLKTTDGRTICVDSMMPMLCAARSE